MRLVSVTFHPEGAAASGSIEKLTFCFRLYERTENARSPASICWMPGSTRS